MCPETPPFRSSFRTDHCATRLNCTDAIGLIRSKLRDTRNYDHDVRVLEFHHTQASYQIFVRVHTVYATIGV